MNEITESERLELLTRHLTLAFEATEVFVQGAACLADAMAQHEKLLAQLHRHRELAALWLVAHENRPDIDPRCATYMRETLAVIDEALARGEAS